MAPASRRRVEVFVVSDGTAHTATAVVKATMAQFRVDRRLRTFGAVRGDFEARRLVAEAGRAGALVVFTMVNKQVAQSLLEEAAARGVPTVDVLGPVISKVADHLDAEPRGEAGLLHGFSDEYFGRIEAVEFAVRHDDGANLDTLFGADLVLTGVSRTSKTPLSMYLAQRGYKTGNVPIVPHLEPPRALVEIDSSKVFGCTIDPEVLLTVRQARVRALGTPPYSRYSRLDAVVEEVRRARRIFRERGWRVVDISGRAVEESASRILQLVESG